MTVAALWVADRELAGGCVSDAIREDAGGGVVRVGRMPVRLGAASDAGAAAGG